ncbi:MAG: MBL fold metallo-hydrolase [Deltaproteobacteria bacterium]|nr:MBL fold metallo-hydrolase [Deltaproteobacteria bacterium]
MEIRFWGTRGSIPSPGPQTLHFGGNTTCVEILLDSGRRIIIDAGTGIRVLGEHLKTSTATVRMHLLLTHNHWDHLLGLPFFDPIYREDTEILIDGWPLAFQALTRVFDDHMGDGFFPVAFDQLKARISFINRLARGPLVLDDVLIEAMPVNHPQGCLGFRLREGNHTLVFITDNELGHDEGRRFRDFVRFAQDCHLLIHDAQYLPEEMPEHRGWGHSTYEEAVRLAVEAKAKRLVLTHHDPGRSDAEVKLILQAARKLVSGKRGSPKIDAAREGASYRLPEVHPEARRQAASP